MLFLLLGTLFVLYLFHELYWKRRNLPPGPTPLPIIGNLIELGKNPPGYEVYCKWKREYGPVYTYWMGTIPIVVISDYETMKETVIKDGDKYAGRWFFQEFAKDFKGGEFGVVNATGELWKDQRRLTLHTLKELGMGKNIMEERVMVEVDFLLERMTEQKEISVQEEMDTAVGSVINGILFGYRFDEENQHEFVLVKTALRNLVRTGSNPLFFLACMAGTLRKIPPFSGAYARVLAENEILFTFIRKQLAKKRKQVDLESENSEDFVESYLKEWNRRKGTPQEEFCFERQLEAVVFDIWAAGMDTTANTLTWAICYILNYPKVQVKIHEELNRVIKSDRKVTLADKNTLPYINAVISEAQRLTNVLPMNLFREVAEDVVMAGHKIAAGTIIIPQISSVLYDEKVFPDSYKFDPDRFMNNDGSYKVVPELVPFSVGRRQCVGEGLAKVELYLFLSNIFQRFKLSTTVPPSMKKGMSNVVVAEPYSCQAELRHK